MEESRRRALSVGFAYLNVQCILYNLSPSFLSNEVDVLLPCPTAQWEAVSATAWTVACRQHTQRTPSLQEALQLLLGHPSAYEEGDGHLTDASCLGNFVLLQALIQRMFYARQLLPMPSPDLREHDLDELEYVFNFAQCGQQY